MTSAIGALATVVVIALRFFTDLATPGWASSVVGSVAVICLQALLLTMMSTFMVLSSRSTFVPPPSEHAKDFIDHVVTLFPDNALGQPAAPRDIAPLRPQSLAEAQKPAGGLVD